MEELKTKPCVGCGYCCLLAPCSASVRLYPGARRCPQLEWVVADNRYVCGLMLIPGNLGHEYKKELAGGEGCCSGLNTWRQDVKNRTKEIDAIGIFSLDPLFQRFLNSLGRSWLSGDALWLTVNAFKIGLVKDDIMSKESA